MITNSLQELNR